MGLISRVSSRTYRKSKKSKKEMSGRKRTNGRRSTPLMIDLTMDEVSDGETAPETTSVQRETRSGIVKTPRAEYEPKIQKDTKTPRKLIQTQNILENRLENRSQNESSSGPSRPKHSKPMKLWNGKKDEQEREKYYREKSEREKSERETEKKKKKKKKSTRVDTTA